MRRVIHRLAWIAVLAGFAAAIAAVPAYADPIAVTSGNINYLEFDAATFSLNRPGQNNMLGDIAAAGPVIPPYACGPNSLTPTTCAGRTLNLSLTQTATQTSFPAPFLDGAEMTVNGVTYTMTSLNWTLHAGDIVVPASGAGALSTPFTFLATTTGISASGLTGTFDWTGAGTATAGFDTVGGWDDTNYTFAGAASPTPEPASLLLFGTGIAGFAARRRVARG